MNVTRGIPEYQIIAPKESLLSWKHNQVSKQVLEIVQAEIQSSKERMGNGETLGENVAQNTARGVGYIEGLQFLESILQLRDVVEDREDVEEKGSNPVR